MKESDLYIPVRDWLQERGHEVHAEIFDADIVTVCDGKLWAVELKPCLDQALYRQLADRERWADYVCGVVAAKPRKQNQYYSHLKYLGYGLLQVTGGRIHQRLKARPQPWQWHKKHAYRMKRLGDRAPAQPHELAGLPCNSQLRQQRRKRESP